MSEKDKPDSSKTQLSSFQKIWTFLYKIRFGLLLTLLIWLQHRYWLFSNIYENFTTHIGGTGSAYYNLAVMMQRAVHVWQGQPLSLEADHYYWFTSTLGITHHHIASGFIFSILYPIFQNPILIFNLIQFGNIILLQIGMYLLVKKYTNNKLIGLLVALLVPLSQAYWTFYANHIHASLFWSLPFLLLFLERLFEKGSLSRLKLGLLLTGIFVTGLWLVFADWHVTVFSLILLIPWGVYKLFWLAPNFQELRIRILGLASVVFLIVLTSLPLIMGTIEASKTYNQVRTLSNVVNTNFKAGQFFGSKLVIESAINTTAPWLRENPRFEQVDFGEKVREIRKGSSSYPDGISNVTFWLGLVVFIPWLLVLCWKKGQFFAREFLFLTIFLLGSFVAIGPFIREFGMTLQQIPLPYYFIYQVFFPLASIRAAWRAMAVAYLGALILWSLILSKLWQGFKKSQAYSRLNTSSTNIWENTFRILTKYSLIGIGAILVIGFVLVHNNGYKGRAHEAFESDSFLTTQWNRASQNNEHLEFFVWSDGAGMHTEKNRYYNYLLSKHNLESESKAVWVLGGSYGATTKESGDFLAYVLGQDNTDIIATTLAAKRTDLIIEEKDFSRSEEYTQEVQTELSNFYQLVDENEEYRVWQWQSAPSDYLSSPESLTFSLESSSIQKQGGKWFMLVNTTNESDQVFVNPDRVKPIEYTIEYWQNGHKQDAHNFKIGEFPFLFAGHGRSLEVVDKPNLSAGQTELKLFREGRFLDSKEVEVLRKVDYNQKIEDLKNQEIKIDQSDKSELTKNRFLQNIGPFRGALHTTNLKLDLKLEEGVIANHPQRRPLDLNNKVIALFWSESGEAYRGFPAWLWQPACELNGNYFAGDEITVWCESHLPLDHDYYFVSPQINEDR